MLLSIQTRKGLKITGWCVNACIHSGRITIPFISVHSFVELAQSLLALPEVSYLLSEKFCQDPIESFFGKQRGHGGRNENPSVKQFLENTNSLRMQGSAALEPLRGNCRKRAASCSAPDNTPLPKRKRSTKSCFL